jgi:methyltransferase (TIGR00027 family)
MTTSRTAEYVALYRALETSEVMREPLFRDPFAALFLPPRLSRALRLARVGPLRAILQRYADWRAPGARSSAIARTRFIDDVVRGAIEEGTQQLVLLGAGYDCRAHRLSELHDARVFEVDRAETQAAKRQGIESARERGTRRDVRYVPVDFGTDDLAASLTSAGWDRTRASIVVWEGVTNYLTEAGVAKVLTLIGGAAAGTLLVFTYVHRGVIDGTARFDGADKLLRNVRRLGEPWTFGLRPDEVGDFLARFGLELEEDVGADEYRRRYLGGGSRNLRGYAFYRIAVARVHGTADDDACPRAD